MKLKLIKICAFLGILGIFTGCSDNVPQQQKKKPEKTVENQNVAPEQSLQKETDAYQWRTSGVPLCYDESK